MVETTKKGAKAFFVLTLMALGVVFGDIGTSPLYTIGELFFPNEGTAVPATADNVVGAISATLWFLYLIVGICYSVFALRADHHREGGVLALFAKIKDYPGRAAALMGLLLILGTGLLMGDGAITPPISILGGLEGLAVATKALEAWIVPITLVILTVLFAFQRKGTATIGLAFGPIMLLWFFTIAALGVALIGRAPEMVYALNPYYGVKFLLSGGQLSMKIHFLGAAMLAITGGEALYADLGHFSKWSIRTAFCFVVVCLTINYLGQGAYVLSGGEVREGNVFYSSALSVVGSRWLYGVITIGTAAAVIASQALITGLFSLVALGMALKLLPKVQTLWTKEGHKGQIYQPSVNWMLYAACCFIVLYFRSTKNLAAAYGLAVSALMLFTCLSLTMVAMYEWGWSRLRAFGTFGFFLVIELGFVVANGAKFFHGGWFPIVIGLVAFVVMTTWRWGVMRVASALGSFSERTVEWLASVKERVDDLTESLRMRYMAAADLLDGQTTPTELDRAIVFLTSRRITGANDRLPATLVAFMRRYGAVPKTILLFHVFVDPDRARLNGDERIEFRNYGSGLLVATATYGYMEVRDVNVRQLLATLLERNLVQVPVAEWQIEIGEEEILAGADLSLFQRLRLSLYRLLRKLATPAHHYLGLEGDPDVSKTILSVRFTKSGSEVVLRGQDPFTQTGGEAGLVTSNVTKS